MKSSSNSRELLDAEERDAWFEYLSVTLGQKGARYRETEPWAWSRLQTRLRALKRRRSRIAV